MCVFECVRVHACLYPDDVILQRHQKQRCKSDTPRGINVPKRPFKITINVYGRIGDVYSAFCVLSVFLEYMVGSPNSGRFLITDASDCSNYNSLHEPIFGSSLYRTDPQSMKHPKLLTYESFR